MSKLIYAEPDDEITNLVDRLRSEKDEAELVFVLPPSSRVLQSGLNARLLMQYSNSLGKTTSIVTPDSRTQGLALETGFTVYPSIAALESGRQLAEAVGADAAPPAASVLAPVVATVGTVSRPERPQRGPSPTQRGPRDPGPRKPLAQVAPDARAGAAPYVLGGVGIVIILLILALVVLPTAVVTIITAAQPVSASPTINGSTAGPGANDQLAIQTTLAQAQESGTQSFPATGKQVNPPVSATGQVTFCYCGVAPFIPNIQFPPNTQVSTDAGQKFRTTSDSGPIKPNQRATVSILAEVGGVASNVSAHTIKNITNNPDPSVFTVDNANPTVGGAEGSQKTVISQADLDNAKNTVGNPLKDKVTADLTGKVGNLHALPETRVINVDATYDHKLNEEVANFNAAVTAKGAVVAIDEKKLYAVMFNALRKSISADYIPTSDAPKYQYQLAQHDDSGNIVIDGTVSGFETPAIDIAALKRAISGKSPSQARVYVKGHVVSTDVIISQSPAFIPWLPFISDRINVREQVENTSGSS